MSCSDTRCSRLERIRLADLWPSAAHPQRLLGEFRGAELWRAVAPDMDMQWLRQPTESAAAFERRICSSIRAARGLPAVPAPVDARGENGRAAARAGWMQLRRAQAAE